MVYEQLHRRDFNPQVNQPVTAYGQFTYFMFAGLRGESVGLGGQELGCSAIAF
jgi:hypothetical protein